MLNGYPPEYANEYERCEKENWLSFYQIKRHSFVHDTVTIDNTLENISQEKDICHNKNDCKSLYAHHTMKIYKRALTQ